jgi:FkbM family methyltransferase
MRASQRLRRAAWRELTGHSTIDMPGGPCRLTWGSRHIQRKRDWDLLFDMAADRTCIFDVGAKVGMTAMAMARGQRHGKVYAFEASEVSSLIINRNLALNGLADRVVTVNGVLGARSGALFEYHWNLVSGRSGIVAAPPQGATPISKVTTSLDAFTAETGLRPDLVKIDVEGGEQEVIAGMGAIMASIRPDIILEMHAWPEMPASRNASLIIDMLKPVDYAMYWITRQQTITDPAAFDDLAPSPVGASSRARVLLIPNDRPAADVLKGVNIDDLDM